MYDDVAATDGVARATSQAVSRVLGKGSLEQRLSWLNGMCFAVGGAATGDELGGALEADAGAVSEARWAASKGIH